MHTPNQKLMGAVLALALAPAATAGLNDFSGNGPAGGRVDQIYLDPSNANRLYASAWGGGIFRSEDGGASWARFDVDHPLASFSGLSDVAIDPFDSTRIFAVDNGSEVLRSDDDGVTWTALTTGIDGVSGLFYLEADRANPNVFFVHSTSRTFRTADGGDTWVDVSATLSDTPKDQFMQSPSDPNVFMVTHWDGVHRSTDGGLTWTDASGGLPLTGNGYVFARVGYIDPNDPLTATIQVSNEGIWRTTNGGQLWERFGASPQNDFFRAMVQDPTDPNRIYLASGNQDILISDNNAQSWYSVANDGLGDYTVNALALHPANPSELWIATATKGIFKTTDRALSWTPSSSGYVNTNVESLAIDQATGQIYAGVNGGVAHSTDDGGTWVDNVGDYDLITFAMAVDPVVPDRAYAGSSCCGLYQSDDAGDTWSRINLQLPVAATWVTDIDIPGNAPSRLLFTDFNRGLFGTTDGGATWAQLSTGLEPFFPGNVVLEDADVCEADLDIIYVASSDFSAGGVYKSTDGGMTWEQKLNARTFSVTVDPMDPNKVYAGRQSIFMYSEDGGDTWITPTSRPPNNAMAIEVDSMDTDLVYAASEFNGLSRSVDGGATWEVIFPGVSNRINSMTVDPADRGRVLLGFDNLGYKEYTFAADTSVSGSGAVTADSGESVAIELTVANAGSRTASNVTLTHEAPIGVTIEAATAAAGSCDIDGQTVSCALGNIDDAANTTVSLDVSGAIDGDYEIVSSVVSLESDPNTADNTLTTMLTVGSVVDTDGDGVSDAADNCTLVSNATQTDADGDGYGNACDADLNNDCVVNVIDLGILRTVFFSTDPTADFNDDGTVNVIDLGLLRTLFFQPPGPAAIDSCAQ